MVDLWLSLAHCPAHSGSLWLAVRLTLALSGPLWLSLACSPALFGSLLLALALSSSLFAYKVLAWLTRPLLSSQQRCCAATLYAGLMNGCGLPNPKNCYEQMLFAIGSCPCLLRRTGQRLTNSCLDCYIFGVAISFLHSLFRVYCLPYLFSLFPQNLLFLFF